MDYGALKKRKHDILYTITHAMVMHGNQVESLSYIMNAQKLAKIFGWVFLIIGVLGFIPGITSNGHLLGIFEVDSLHNIIHLLSGIVALWLSKSESGAKSYFKIFGIVYALVTVLGFFSNSVLGLIHVNLADNVLHLVIAAIALWVGFSGKKPSVQMPPVQGGMQM